ncbi:zinc finger protein 106-like [Mytilus californianus]|uniref:zinc finger protein 106-like n=1 Tax=Mytilus californianus TaxID=6549 RepID=UPI00224814BB|nr:zinc finger protein 106-like [Mytilus californianus]
MIWTYTQAAGIITTVCVYEDLLFSVSFNKFFRCYTRQDHKLKALYYGADRGLVTQMTVIDDKIITGNRNGIVEVIPINRDKETMCQFEGCCHVFGIKPHLLSHVMSDHVTPDTKMFRCLWRGCKDWLSTKEGHQEAEEHMKLHIFT